MSTQVLLVDDHPIVREGIRRLIEQEPDLSVCGEAEDGPEALTLIDSAKPDVIVLDLSLKQSSGLDLIRDITNRNREACILVLSMYDESMYAERALRAGAQGYVMKQEAPRRVITAIRRVLDGGIYVSEAIADKVLLGMVGGSGAGATPVEALSDRELQVFQLIGEGRSHQEIADHLSLSIKTVESHVERIKDKLSLRSGRELIREAVEWVVTHKA